MADREKQCSCCAGIFLNIYTREHRTCVNIINFTERKAGGPIGSSDLGCTVYSAGHLSPGSFPFDCFIIKLLISGRDNEA